MKNIVEEYLSENHHLKLSLKSIYKRLEIKKGYAMYLIKNSDKIRQVNPLEVGSRKKDILVFTCQ